MGFLAVGIIASDHAVSGPPEGSKQLTRTSLRPEGQEVVETFWRQRQKNAGRDEGGERETLGERGGWGGVEVVVGGCMIETSNQSGCSELAAEAAGFSFSSHSRMRTGTGVECLCGAAGHASFIHCGDLCPPAEGGGRQY